jgi:hypothetical protein
MTTAVQQAQVTNLVRNPGGRWFFVTMALAMIALTIAGFLPAIINPVNRRAPLTPLAAAHGIVVFLWQLLYLLQALLIANRRIDLHRRLGLASIALLVAIIPLGFTTTTAMIRRGYDLSGDQGFRTSQEAIGGSVFNFAALLSFLILAVAAIGYRRRPAVHKRLMLFAAISLIVAPIAHLGGHLPISMGTYIAMYSILYTLFLLAPVAFDYLTEKRVRFLTTAMAVGLFASQLVQAFVIGPSPAWQRFCTWISQ